MEDGQGKGGAGSPRPAEGPARGGQRSGRPTNQDSHGTGEKIRRKDFTCQYIGFRCMVAAI